MANVKIKFIPAGMMTVDMYLPGGKETARRGVASGLYVEESKWFEVNGDSKDAAEDAFDLTNNPSRQDEREQVYGRGRSLNVGDIVVVGEEVWLCAPMGWVEL